MNAGKKTKVDPELKRQIAKVAAADRPIQAVFSLNLPLKKRLDPVVVEETSHNVIKRAEEKAGTKHSGVNVFKNLGSFAVSGDARLIENIIDDPDVASAVANDQPEEAENS